MANNMIRFAAVVLAPSVVCFAVSTGAQKPTAPPSVDLVELDVVVTDGQGRAVSGLEQEDFEVKEDGKSVELKTFLAASASGSTAVDDGRSMVLLLDDVGVAPVATSSIRSVAAYVVSRGGPGDDLSVVRFNNRTDEPYGDFLLALTRISEYRAGVAPFERLRSTEDMLKLVANLARRLEANGRRRKAIVCIGSQAICNITEPLRTAPGSIWKDWVEALGAAARANVSLYAVMSTRGRLPDSGMVHATGGEVFGSRGDLRPYMDRIWRDTSHHYLIGYWPSGSSRELHSISVKVKQRGARVLTRKWRGN